MIVGNKDQRAIPKLASSERFMYVDNRAVVYLFPLPRCVYGLFVGEPKAFEAAEGVEFAILARLRFVQPGHVSEG